tara:strand:+ start:105 stop:485 length:381 start_codon:yes stop_codon:yes gene_type:complete
MVTKPFVGKGFCFASEQQLVGIKERKKRPRHSHFLCKEIDKSTVKEIDGNDVVGNPFLPPSNDNSEYNIIGEFVFTHKSNNEGIYSHKLIPDDEDVLKEILVIAPELLDEVEGELKMWRPGTSEEL